MKRVYLLVFNVLFLAACNINNKKDPYKLLNHFSSLEFNRYNTAVIYAEEHTSGFKQEGDLTCVLDVQKLNMDSLQNIFISLGYQKLPLPDTDLGDGFHGNLKMSDSGYYLRDLKNGITDKELVIFNLTQKKVIYYKLLE
jgi:hypothetical protein